MTKFIAFVSGKGGVGKTTTTLNLGYSLAQLGHRVTLVDANIATPNLAIHLGLLNPKNTLNNYLRKEIGLDKATYQYEGGFSFIPASPSLQEFHKTSLLNLSRLYKELDEKTDFVLIDSPSGLGSEVNQILKNTDEVVIVVNPTLTSVMDALKTIKAARAQNAFIAGVILNMARRFGRELKAEEIESILEHPIIGKIPKSNRIQNSLHSQEIFASVHHLSGIAREYKKVAEYLSHLEKTK